ncbi:hypothetical protein Hanom_Chr06g00486461 [Helianthus anomalus]
MYIFSGLDVNALKGVVESDHRITTKLNKLTAWVSKIHEKQVELQVAIDMHYVRHVQLNM